MIPTVPLVETVIGLVATGVGVTWPVATNRRARKEG